jgi:putative Mn2+ efflux pump MntP
MELHEIAGIGVALGIDCLAVSAGFSTMRPPKASVVATCLMFGLFQAGMTLGGMAGGAGLTRVVESPLRFAPPVILCGVGLLMLLSSPGSERRAPGPIGLVAIVAAAISVSLDALGAGVAMGIASLVSVPAALLIGAISVGMSAGGFAGGAWLASRSAVAERVGGIILIALAAIMFVTALRT